MLSLIGAIFHLIGGLLVIFFGSLIAAFGLGGVIPGGAPTGTLEALTVLALLFIVLPIIFIILAFLGAFWMYSGDKTRTTYGGVLTLIISIVAFATIWGLVIGSLLGFIGAILALVWNPTPAMPAPVAAGTPPPAAPAPEPSPAPAPEPISEPEEPSIESEEQ